MVGHPCALREQSRCSDSRFQVTEIHSCSRSQLSLSRTIVCHCILELVPLPVSVLYQNFQLDEWVSDDLQPPEPETDSNIRFGAASTTKHARQVGRLKSAKLSRSHDLQGLGACRIKGFGLAWDQILSRKRMHPWQPRTQACVQGPDPRTMVCSSTFGPKTIQLIQVPALKPLGAAPAAN